MSVPVATTPDTDVLKVPEASRIEFWIARFNRSILSISNAMMFLALPMNSRIKASIIVRTG